MSLKTGRVTGPVLLALDASKEILTAKSIQEILKGSGTDVSIGSVTQALVRLEAHGCVRSAWPSETRKRPLVWFT